MNNEAMKEVLNELFSHLEKLETQSEAIRQFLKEKKRVTDKQLAPYLEQAGNASNVRWRAARVRIERLLTPEHPEKEVKLGKQPELHEDPAESKQTEAGNKVDKEDKRTELGDKDSTRTDTEKKDKSAPAAAVETRPADDKVDKPGGKSATELKPAESAAQDKHEQKSDSEDFHHPTEVTAPLAEQEGAEPAAKLDSKEKNKDQEAA
jgi:hypothetical protein